MGKNFQNIFKCLSKFLEISELARWHAALARSWLAALGTRLRAVLFSFCCTRRRPGDTRRGLAEAAARFLKIFALQGVSFRISRFRGSAAPWPANPGQVAFAAEVLIAEKIKTGQRGINTWRGGRTTWCRIFVLRTVFLLNEFYSSPLKASVEHEDVDLAISPETNVINIGTRSNDLEFGIRRNVAKFWL